jgi:hypothetical protein
MPTISAWNRVRSYPGGVQLTDVAINSLTMYLYIDTDGHYAVNQFVQLQTAFLGFVLGSAPFLWFNIEGKDAV